MPRCSMTPTTFQNLPIEIIFKVFTYLNMLDLLACSVVSKHLRRIITDSSQLQYTIELGKHRMVSTLPSSVGPPFSMRLKVLRERERAWKYLDWKKSDTLRLPPTGSIYEFVGGLYGNGREDESRVTASISFLELPSTDESGQDLEMWTHSMGDITIVDFTMDPSQDLLVLVALAPADSRYIYELHLRSIKTNEPHPMAPMPILSCLRKPSLHLQASDVVAAVRVQVAGELLALLIKEAVEGTTAHLEIWNWVASPQFSSAMGRADGIDDFTFLNDRSFLLVLPPGQFEVYTFSDLTKSSNSPVLRVTYAFPPLSDGYMYWYISMSSNPAPGYVPCPTSNQDAVPGKDRQLYYPQPAERIHACCLYIYNPSAEETQHVQSFVFFVNLQSLINPPEEWFARPKSPRPKVTQRRHPADRLHSSLESPPPASSSTFFPERSSSALHRPVSAPAYSGTLQPSSSINGDSSNASQHLPLYPPFPSFDSRPHSPNGQIPSGEYPSPAPSVPPASGGFINPSTTRRRKTRPVTTLSDKAYTVPWDVWGPQSTRWFEECLSTDWQHAVYGLRTVESLDPTKYAQPRVAVEESSNQHSMESTAESSSPLTYVSMGIQTGSPTNGIVLSAMSEAVNGGLQSADSATGITSLGPTSSSSQMQGSDNQSTANVVQNGTQVDGEGDSRSRWRFLRLRDFNPYSFESGTDPLDKLNFKGKGKASSTTHWRRPRLVTEPSTTPVKGVFKRDIVSSLPYTEIISAEAFEVTDVMMDDCRLLLLSRGETGKLKQVDVLMM